MNHSSSKLQAGANLSIGMEQRPLEKRAGAKSRKSSGNKLIICVLTAVLCISCGTDPQKEGEKLGQEYCDCQKEYVKTKEATYTDFLAKFDTYGFKTRSDARQKWQDLQDTLNRHLQDCKAKVEEKVNTVKSEFPTSAGDLLDVDKLADAMKNPQKYAKELEKRAKEFAKNQEKAAKFNEALQTAEKNCAASEPQIDEQKIQEKILSVKPGKPDASLLKKTLVNRRIIEPADGYFGRGWAFQIKSMDEVKNVRIDSIAQNGEDYEIAAHLILQNNNSQTQYEADVTITMVLGTGDDYTIDFIKTRVFKLAKTGRYNDCVKTEVKRSWGTNLQFTNSCDVNLIVGGQIENSNGEWIKFSCSVNASSNGSVSYNGKSYRIDFIERQ